MYFKPTLWTTCSIFHSGSSFFPLYLSARVSVSYFLLVSFCFCFFLFCFCFSLFLLVACTRLHQSLVGRTLWNGNGILITLWTIILHLGKEDLACSLAYFLDVNKNESKMGPTVLKLKPNDEIENSFSMFLFRCVHASLYKKVCPSLGRASLASCGALGPLGGAGTPLSGPHSR